MERNFTKLLDRYQKSKQLIDNLYDNIQSNDQRPRSISQNRKRLKSSKMFDEFDNEEYDIKFLFRLELNKNILEIRLKI